MSITSKLFARTSLCLLALCATLATTPARAHSEVSEASALSLLPVAVSVAAPVLVLAGGAALTVVAVQASATGTVWVLERGSDAARMSVQFAGHTSTALGTAVVVTAVSTGWLLVTAGAAVAFIPNEIGRSLLHNERLTR